MNYISGDVCKPNFQEPNGRRRRELTERLVHIRKGRSHVGDPFYEINSSEIIPLGGGEVNYETE